MKELLKTTLEEIINKVYDAADEARGNPRWKGAEEALQYEYECNEIARLLDYQECVERVSLKQFKTLKEEPKKKVHFDGVYVKILREVDAVRDKYYIYCAPLTVMGSCYVNSYFRYR